MRVSVNKSQKAAWNATMREEVGIVSKEAAYEEAKQRGRVITTRSSNKTGSGVGGGSASHARQNVHGGISELEFKRQARLERLELTNSWDFLERGGKASGEAGAARSAMDEDYQSSGDDSSVGGAGEASYEPSKKKRRKRSTPSPAPSSSASTAAAITSTSATTMAGKKAVGKQAAQVFLADVLLKDSNSADFVNAMARRPVGRRADDLVCDVTGKPALYTDPVTGLRVADRRALIMLREQVPAWLKATAISPYWDAVQIIRQESSKE